MGLAGSALQMPKCRGVDIEELSIAQLQNHLGRGAFTCRELTACYLERIKSLNPRIKAVIEVNPDALEIADILDSERQKGGVRSGIHGIPFLVKDNINTGDKMRTTAGCTALLYNKVEGDATVVKYLRDAGGVLLGKANLSEWASMRASYYAEAYSSRGGQNRNPYNLAEHPGGSSSGPASGVAVNMCAFSIGTETDGSIMFPADRNAVVGIKPTVGLVSTDGVVPEAPSMDTVGTFGRSVADAALILDIIAQSNSANARGNVDMVGQETSGSDNSPYSAFLTTKEALKGANFGLPQKRIWESARNNKKHEASVLQLSRLIQRIKEAGATVVDVDLPSAEEIIPPDGWDWTYGAGDHGSELSEFEVAKWEFYRSLTSYLAENPGPMCSLEDVMAYNIQHTDKEGGVPGTHLAWPTGQDTFEQSIETKDSDDSRYHRAREYITRKSREEGIDAALNSGSITLDALLVPLQAEGGVACSVAAKAGYPMVSIPVGTGEDSVPFGIGLMQTAGKERTLIRYASAIEDITGSRARPRFVNPNANNYTYVGVPP